MEAPLVQGKWESSRTARIYLTETWQRCKKMSFEDWQVQLAVHLAKILRVFGKNLPRFTIVSLVL